MNLTETKGGVNKPKVLVVANQKGGVGKTTTSICVAQELMNRGFRVLFLDSDSQCNSTSFYEAETEGEATLVDILCGDMKASECIQKTEKGDIIPSDKILKDAETLVRVDERRFTHLKRSLKTVQEDYDYIVVDTPPIIGVCLKNVLAAADHIIIPCEESGWALEGLMDFAEAIELAKDNNENLNVAGILMVKAKSRTKKAARMNDLATILSEKLNTIVFDTKIRESVACTEALTEFFEPLHEYAPNSTTNQDYKDFVEELLEVINNG